MTADGSARREVLHLGPAAALPAAGWLAEACDVGAPHHLLRVLPDGSCLLLAEAALSGRTDARRCRGGCRSRTGGRAA